MPEGHCKVYIHDLDANSERQARHQLLMSGARFATKIRFVTDLQAANIWVLRHNSASVGNAIKRSSQHNIAVWLFNEKQQFINAQNQQLLSQKHMAAFVDACISGANVETPQRKVKAVSATKLVKYLRYGFNQKRGKLFLRYHQAHIRINFAKMQVEYNNAGEQLFSQGSTTAIDLDQFEIINKRDAQPNLLYQCHAFAWVWGVIHNAKSKTLLAPLTQNSVLKLVCWPNFELVQHDFADYRLASFLQKRSLNSGQISVLLKLPEAQIHQFFNTMFITGCAELSQQTKALAMPKQDVAQHGLSLMWQKLRKNFVAKSHVA